VLIQALASYAELNLADELNDAAWEQKKSLHARCVTLPCLDEGRKPQLRSFMLRPA